VAEKVTHSPTAAVKEQVLAPAALHGASADGVIETEPEPMTSKLKDTIAPVAFTA
jgi:hypothetical protein